MRMPALATAGALPLSALVTLGAAAPAVAADPGDVVVQPDPVTAGQDFAVHGPACEGLRGTARFRPPPEGTALPEIELERLPKAVGGTGSVPAGAVPGRYKVTIDCVGGPFTGALTVSAASGAAPSTPSPPAASTPAPASVTSPSAAPSRPVSSGPANSTVWGVGGAAVLALIGGGLWYRRHGEV